MTPGWIWTRAEENAAGADKPKWEKTWGHYHLTARCGEPVEMATDVLSLRFVFIDIPGSFPRFGAQAAFYIT